MHRQMAVNGLFHLIVNECFVLNLHLGRVSCHPSGFILSVQ